MMKVLAFLAAALAMAAPVLAEDTGVEVRALADGEVSPPATIDDIAWLAGRWVGEGLGGKIEEVIAPAEGGQMMGMFRHWSADGAVKFYEFYVFDEKDGSLTLRLKHFWPTLIGWEEKAEIVEFPLVAIEGETLYLDGLTYSLKGDGALLSAVRLSDDEVAQLRLTRAALD